MSKSLLIYAFILIDAFVLIGLKMLGGAAILALDTSFITHAILTLYFLANFLMLFIWYFNDTVYGRKLLGWVPSALVSLGLLGTVIGMFTGFNDLFANLNFSDFENTKEILGQMVNGFSVALLTTIAGIGTSLMLTLKFVWFNDKVVDNEEN